MSASTSSRVECTANEARDEAVMPRRCMSGWAQWCPARTQTPRRPRISAASCGWMPSSVNEQTEPLLGGGHMIARVNDFESTWAEPPARFEGGTMPIAEAIGLGAAVDWLAGLGMDNVWEHSRDVVGHAVERLGEVDGLTLHGPSDLAVRGAVCSFALDGVHPHDVAEILGRRGVCVRAGHHCAQVLMRRLGVHATSRASFAVHSTREDVDRLIAGLHKVTHDRPCDLCFLVCRGIRRLPHRKHRAE